MTHDLHDVVGCRIGECSLCAAYSSGIEAGILVVANGVSEGRHIAPCGPAEPRATCRVENAMDMRNDQDYAVYLAEQVIEEVKEDAMTNDQDHNYAGCQLEPCDRCFDYANGYAAGKRKGAAEERELQNDADQARDSKLRKLLSYIESREGNPPSYYSPQELAYVMGCSMPEAGMIVGATFGVAKTRNYGYSAPLIHSKFNELAGAD